jgi:hypothetical protein
MSSLPGRPATTEQATGTKETMYALVSVLSHTLQGAETLGHDRQDATAAGDQELMQFLVSAGRCAACRSVPLGSVSPPLLRAPRSPCPRCGPRWLAPECSCDLPLQVWSLTHASRALRVALRWTSPVHGMTTAPQGVSR